MSAPANRQPLSTEAAYAAASVALPASTFASKHSPSASPSFRETIEAAKARDHHFNNLPSGMETDDPAAYRAEEERLWAASGAAVHSVPATWGEFIDLLDYMSTGGTDSVEDHHAAMLLAHARRLNGAFRNDQLEATFAAWQRAIERISASTEIGGDHLAGDWDEAGAAETVILAAPDVTPRIAVMRLWIGLHHSITDREQCRAVARCDLSWLLARADELDWDDRLFLNALAAIEGQPGALYTPVCPEKMA